MASANGQRCNKLLAMNMKKNHTHAKRKFLAIPFLRRLPRTGREGKMNKPSFLEC
jgi:hypothetical protein